MNRLLTIVDSKYQRLEYLEGTGTQYIDTGLAINNTYSYSLTLKFNLFASSSNRDGSVWGARTSSNSSDESVIWVAQTNQLAYYRFTWGGNATQFDFDKNLFEWDPNGIFINGVKISSSKCKNNDKSAILFGFRQGDYVESRRFYGRIYHYSVKDGNGVLVRNFVPVLRKTDNELGMLDLVEGKFYPNAGTGKFLADGMVGYTVVGSPTITDGVVSGFSSANYLYLPPAPSWSNIDVLETFTTFTTSTMNTLQIVMGGRYSQATCCVEITSANKTLFRITYIDSGGTARYKETTINYVLSANTKYKVKNYFNKQTLVIKTELYDENGIMLASASDSLTSDYTSIANINDFWYGYNTQRGTFSGSIDFNNNNTYVKINNKLWFNGQQA